MDNSMENTNLVRLNQQNFQLNQLMEALFLTFDGERTRFGKSRVNLVAEKAYSDSDSMVYSDEVRLTRIMQIFLDNALRLTENGSIRFGYRPQADRLAFFVTDTGPGIPPEKHKGIFGQITQKTSASEAGTGEQGPVRGLGIAKALVNHLGGEIGLVSEPGSGSTFFFLLPLSIRVPAEKPLTGSDPAKRSYDFSGKTILVAEDVPENFELLRLILRRYHPALLNACTGLEAVEWCRTKPEIDLVLMDIGMPELDGYEATRRIREFHPTLPIIALTAHALAEEKEQTLEAGCTDYLPKPIAQKELLALLDRYLNQSL